MTWDDETEQLTLQVVERLGEPALEDVLRKTLCDVLRDGEQIVPPAWVQKITAGGDLRSYGKADWLQAYKARLRALLATH